MAHIYNFEKFNESFTKLKDDEKILLKQIVDELGDKSSDKTYTNSEVANPRGLARNPFYKSGQRKLKGLGNPYSNIVPGSVEKNGKEITAKVKHGMDYESGKKTEFTSIITLNTETGDYDIRQEESSL
jgi:hypothetical protein